MIAKLLKEAEEEATQKAFCDAEMGKSKTSKDKKTMTLDKLQTRIDGATSTIAENTESIKLWRPRSLKLIRHRRKQRPSGPKSTRTTSWLLRTSKTLQRPWQRQLRF